MAFSDAFNIPVRANKAKHIIQIQIPNLRSMKETTDNQREMANSFKKKGIPSLIM